MSEQMEHGLRRYRRRGCRCDICRAARAEYDRQRTKEPYKPQAPHGQCAIDGCGRNWYSRKGSPDGWCRHHHMSWAKYGDPLVGFQRGFEALVDKSAGPDACWPWKGARIWTGYGYFHSQYVHRISHELYVGPIPEGMQIDHICHVRLCVNPGHLRLATAKQNKEHRQGAQKNSESGIRGVRRCGRGWLARVRHNGKDLYLGIHDTPEEAAEAARLKRLELFTHNDIDRRAV